MYNNRLRLLYHKEETESAGYLNAPGCLSGDFETLIVDSAGAEVVTYMYGKIRPGIGGPGFRNNTVDDFLYK
jgi:hypothetical protein